MTTLPNNQKKNWEEQFDKKFQPKTKGAVAMINFDFFVADAIKAFIRRLISDYSQRVEEEVWKSVVGFEGSYLVSSFGRIMSIKRHRPSIVGQSETNCGYLRVVLSDGKRGHHFLVHRLVAEAFIEDKAGDCVNHKDSNRKNNHVSNLEWCTHKENTKHGISMGRIKFPTYERIPGSKDKCINGHAFTKENTYIREGKYKVCRKCNSEFMKRYRSNKKLNSLNKEMGL